MQGILLVDKPAGWTSFDVVNYIRKIVAAAEGKKPKNVKIGHTGTLDPFATGLLVLLISKEYTRRAGELAKLDKTYEVTLRLGETSTTGDPEGAISPYPAAEVPDEIAIRAALQQFTGEIAQVPPAYSAIKVNGRRAYQLARAGEEVVIEPRQVTISRLQLLEYAYPEARFVANVSSGTYIRTLVEDVGRALGCGAYTVTLRRTEVGTFTISDAIGPDEIQAETLPDRLQML